MPVPEPEETRAEIARRRLTELAATFHASMPDTSSSREFDPEDSSRYAEHPENVEPHAVKRRSLSVPHVKFVALAAAVAVLGVGWWLLSAGFAKSANSTPVAPLVAQPSERTGSASKEPETLIVHVAGDVKKPGIVTLPAGARVDDAIKAAGGVVGKPNLSEINLARTLADGEQVRIGLPPLGEAAITGGTSSPGVGQGGTQANTINLNTANQGELETLPGVGPVTAQAILDWRHKNQRFQRVEDLLDVRGIGDATLERLRPLVSL